MDAAGIIETLVPAYLDVVNRAIAQNRDRVPYKQLLAGAERLLEGRTIAVVLLESDGRELGRVPVTLSSSRLEIADGAVRAEQGRALPALEWKVRRDHIEHVVADPYPYVESPLKLDIDWLRTRVTR